MYNNLNRKQRFGRHFWSGLKITLFLLMLTGLKANAQNIYGGGDYEETFGVGINADYDMPVGNLKYTYKSAPAYGGSVYMYQEDFTYSISVNFREYKPKQDVFYYLVNDNDYGTATYSSFKTTMAYFGAAYNLPITDEFRVYGGINMGFYFSKFKSRSVDAFVDSSEDINEKEGYGAPKLGLNLSLNDHVLVSVQGSYNFFAPLGRSDYNSRVGTLYTSLSTGAALIYRF